MDKVCNIKRLKKDSNNNDNSNALIDAKTKEISERLRGMQGLFEKYIDCLDQSTKEQSIIRKRVEAVAKDVKMMLRHKEK